MPTSYSYQPSDPPTTSAPWWKARALMLFGLVIFLFLVGILAPLAYFSLNPYNPGSANSPTPTPSIVATATPTPTATAQASSTPSVSPTSQAQSIRVYFSRHPESDSNFSQVYQVDRSAPDAGVAKAAFQALLAGPTAAEQSRGLFSEWNLSGASSCGDDGFTLDINNGRATIKLCRDFSSAGTGQDARAQAEADATLRQFPTITKVTYLSKTGNCLFDQSGQNQCLQ